MKIKIIRVDKSLPLPAYQTAGAVAFDMYSRLDAEIAAGAFQLLPSNLIIEVPQGCCLVVAARSSLVKKGLMKANGVGIVDQDYHGPTDEVGILAYNFTKQSVKVSRGERIAQGLIVPVEKAEWQEVENIKSDSRGGFGSTG
jgi:dUTP pyrophosphatase